MEYYSGKNLRNKKDLQNKKPKFLLSVGGRSTGKTVDWNSFVLNEFIKNKKQFILYYRYKYEITNIADRFFKSIDFRFDGTMTDKNTENLGFSYLYYNDEQCGFAVAINSANNIKKFSALFENVEYIVFDEFIPEDGRYCPDEIKKFTSLYISIARGKGKTIRENLQIIMIANLDTNDNLYFHQMKIRKTNKDTRFQRGNGWVCEFVENKEVAAIQKEDPVIQLFDTGYITGEKTNDDLTNVEKIVGGLPMYDLEINGKVVGVWASLGNIYLNEQLTNKNVYCYNRFNSSEYPYNDSAKRMILSHLEKGRLKFTNLHIKNIFFNN